MSGISTDEELVLIDRRRRRGLSILCFSDSMDLLDAVITMIVVEQRSSNDNPLKSTRDAIVDAVDRWINDWEKAEEEVAMEGEIDG